jgi:hypothetical protein
MLNAAVVMGPVEWSSDSTHRPDQADGLVPLGVMETKASFRSDHHGVEPASAGASRSGVRVV